MGIFSSLENLGLGKTADIDLYGEEEKKKNAEKDSKPAARSADAIESDYILDKTIQCPVCEENFKVKTVKAGKMQLEGSDSDLRARYKGLDPLKYDAIVCSHCGYGALNRFFKSVTPTQEKLIKAEVSANFKGLKEVTTDIYSYEDAFVRHQIALVNAVAKRSKTSERAYICLKTAWIIRGMSETLPKNTPNYDQVIQEYEKEELGYVNKAYQGLKIAFSQEDFPMCGMDEMTVTYLVAELARKTGDYDEAAKMVSRVIISKTASDRLKERARELKDKIKSVRQQ